MYLRHLLYCGYFFPENKSSIKQMRLTVITCSLLLTAETATAADGDVTLDEVVISAQRLDAARNGLSTSTGGSIYNMDSSDIQALPLGEFTPMNQVILQAPGVVQDSFGQLHIRGDHGNVQYRINGVVIPEAISGFGQALDTRIASQVSVLTGALPAQYGLHTAGVVDIHTKGYAVANSGNASLTLGTPDDVELGSSFTGSSGGLSGSFTGSYLQNDLGIENPTSSDNAIHDHTKQLKGFGYLSYILNDRSRLSMMLGATHNQFEIPNVRGFNCNNSSCYALSDVDTTTLDSTSLDARQNETNVFDALTYQNTDGELNFQASLIHRYSTIHYYPDTVGELVFNGIAATIKRRDEEIGFQSDFSYPVNIHHTLRSGVYVSSEKLGIGNNSQVFRTDDNGVQSSDVPLSIMDNSQLTSHVLSMYMQDEWKLSQPLTINYGLRFDRVKTQSSEQQASPRVGLIYDINSSTHFHLGYARYFTPPPTEKIDTTSISKFQNTSNALPGDANTSVVSERSNYLDGGLSKEITTHLVLGLDTYYRKVAHLQDEGQFGKALVFSAFNFADGRVYGAELSASYANSNVSGYANVAWSVAQARRIESGEFNFDSSELDYIASHWVYLDHDQRIAASAGASYTWHGLHISADLLYGSGLRRGFANTDKLPAYTEVNVAIGREFNWMSLGKFDLKLAVINIFDCKYQLRDGSGIGVGAPQYGARRSIYVSLSKSY